MCRERRKGRSLRFQMKIISDPGHLRVVLPSARCCSPHCSCIEHVPKPVLPGCSGAETDDTLTRPAGVSPGWGVAPCCRSGRGGLVHLEAQQVLMEPLAPVTPGAGVRRGVTHCPTPPWWCPPLPTPLSL